MFVIYYDDKVGFFVVEEFFDDYMVVGIVKGIVCEYIVDCIFGFGEGYGNDDIFVCCQIIGFDYNWCVLFMNVVQGQVYIGEVGVGCGWDLLVGQKIFGECFGVFELGGVGIGVKYL